MNLLVVGASYQTADMALLERLSVPSHGRSDVLAALLAREHVTEAVVRPLQPGGVYAGVTGFRQQPDVSAVLAGRQRRPRLSLRTSTCTGTPGGHTLRVAAGLDSWSSASRRSSVSSARRTRRRPGRRSGASTARADGRPFAWVSGREPGQASTRRSQHGHRRARPRRHPPPTGWAGRAPHRWSAPVRWALASPCPGPGPGRSR